MPPNSDKCGKYGTNLFTPVNLAFTALLLMTKHDAASDQQFPGFQRHWDPSECPALVTETCISIA
jgi:hypothetical protein